MTAGRALVLAAAIVLATVADASAPQDLQRFFTKVLSYSARFNQVVLDDAGKPIQESTGKMWIQRPGKFRWQYSKPFEQQIVADGKKIWVYDVDLRQVAVRPMKGTLGAAPAMLLAGGGNLQSAFEIKDAGKADDLDWVQMKPRQTEGGFELIRIGFLKGRIRRLDMTDAFGQVTRVILDGGVENASISADRFQFKPPKGVDVITE